MLLITTRQRRHSKLTGPLGRARLAAVGTAIALAALWLPGCGKTDDDVPPAEVKTVEAYGVTLDENATPQQVAFVLLRSLADDVQAAQSFDRAAQKTALRRTFSLAAYSEIERRLLATVNRKETTLGQNRDKELFNIVNYWAPIVAHYVRSFDADSQTAAGKMRVRTSPDQQRANVYYDACHDPAETAPARQQRATLNIELTREAAGGKSYWRVAHIDYATLSAKAHTRPASGPAATQSTP